MSQHPWRNTSEDIAKEAQSQWETPGGAQEKADAAEQAAKNYSDEKLNEHIGTGGSAHATVIAGGAAGFMTGPDKAKLDGVAPGANNYIHPATHPPSIIAQDVNNRFVTDAEKSDWNAKAPSTLATATSNGLMSAPDKDKLDKATSSPTANTIIIRDASGRAQVAAPNVGNDIARKSEVDAVQINLDSHAADTNVHVTAADHTKLNGIQSGAEVNQNAFTAVNDVLASSKTDALELTGGTGITITTDPSNKRVTVTATGTATPGPHASSHITGGTDVIPNAVTNGSSGLMSGADAQFVRIEGETKAGAQTKADAALGAANEYTDGKATETLNNANDYTDRQISIVTANYIRQPGYAATTGSASAYIATLDPVPTSLPDGFGITIVPHVTNDAGATLNINGLGAAPLKRQDGSAYDAGDLLAGKPYTFRKVGSDFLADSGGGEVEIPGQTEMTVTYSEDIAKGDMVRVYTPPIELLPPPATVPTAASIGIAMTNDYMAVGTNVSPFLMLYKRSGDVFNKLTNPSVLPSEMPRAIAFSPNADYLYLGLNAAPYLMIYKRSGDTFTKLPDPTVLPGGSIGYLRAANDGTYIYMILSAAPYFMMYKRTGDTFTKLADPSVNPLSSNPRNLAVSPSGEFIAISYLDAPYILIYKRSGDVLSKIADPSIAPPAAFGISFTHDERYLTSSYIGGAGLITYKRTGDVFNKVPDTKTKTPATSTDVVYHPNKMTLFLVQSNNGPDVLIYSQREDQLYQTTNSQGSKSQSANRIVISPDGSYLAISSNTSPYVNVFKIRGEEVRKVDNMATLMSETNVGVIGYAKEGGSAGDSRKIIALIQ